MKILFHKNFKRNYKKRLSAHKKLDLQFKNRILLFLKNPKNPTLKDHKLLGSKKEYRAFSITGDIRVVYRIVDKDTILLYDIGSHNQVY